MEKVVGVVRGVDRKLASIFAHFVRHLSMRWFSNVATRATTNLHLAAVEA